MMTEWHPIDDTEHPAPRDGTEILVYAHGRYWVVYWEKVGKFKANEGWAFGNGLWDGQMIAADAPTHWMPLPPPPEDGK